MIFKAMAGSVRKETGLKLKALEMDYVEVVVRKE